MNRTILTVFFVTAILCIPSMTLFAAENKVVVIPLNSASNAQKELYVPASLFRPVSDLLSGSWLEDGSILKPNGSGYWVAPLLLPTGTTIASLELYWKNDIYNTGISSVILHLFNLLNGNGAHTYTANSSVTASGVQTVSLNTNNFPVTESLKPSILVYLSNGNRFLMGVKVVYR